MVILDGGSTYRVPSFGLKGDFGKLDPAKSITLGNALSAAPYVLMQMSTGNNGKFNGSWANKAFDFATSFPALKLVLLAPAREFAIDVYSLKTGGYIRSLLK